MSAALPNPLARYARWLHTGWPAGSVEKLPAVRDDGSTNVPGLYVAGDLTGVPLLKVATDTGARAVRTILADPAFRARTPVGGGAAVHDLAIVGAGVSGMSAALEARKNGLDFVVFEASGPFATIVDFPAAKPIFTYPTSMVPAGDLKLSASIKESLVEELRAQTLGAGIAPRAAKVEAVRRKRGVLEVELASGEVVRAHRVIVGIGRSGNFRRLGVPGEDDAKVHHRLHDPKDFAGQDVLVVGGGDSALEAATALAAAGARVTLTYRNAEFSRPKPETVSRLVAQQRAGPLLRVALSTRVKAIRATEVVLTDAEGRDEAVPNDAVFAQIGREAPLDFFRRCGVTIRGEWTGSTWAGLAAFLLVCAFLYNWKAGGVLYEEFRSRRWFPFGVPGALGAIGAAWSRPSNLLGTLALSLGSPGFYYSLAYCACVVVFGARRISKRKTPYVTAQTLTLMAVQVVPLFLLPYVVLPWIGHNGGFDVGPGRWLGDQLFPQTAWDAQGREYWRAFGFVLAWPLFVWNVFSPRPMALWLAISLVQTFVVIPLIVYRWGKGAYCGWICSCGALSETLGDAHRQKMPHGPFWNRLNMTGQVVLGAALLLAALRVIAWTSPGSFAGELFNGLLNGWHPFGIQTNYYWIVDVGLAGILGLGLYFHASGRVWCRFACPLAALMHVYARFTSFRILSDKKKCISCNVCTSVCHQGIDVMSFANKGIPMDDPQCVRCSACVQSCPTGVLSFGRVDRNGSLISIESLIASPVQREELPSGGSSGPSIAS